MRRFLISALLLGVFFLAGRFWSEVGVHAGGSGGALAGNGDVNGDGNRDISDAVALLSWLFMGGNEPVACGQTDCCLTAEQKEILGCMSIETPPEMGGKKTLRISGVNVQIVNGQGFTSMVNGLGNLIVGYQENRQGINDRSGSHNLVVGDWHNYTRYGGFVAGLENTISGNYSTVTGGRGNEAQGPQSSVTGGQGNIAIELQSSATGGQFNIANGVRSSITGGLRNVTAKEVQCLGDSFGLPRFVDNGDGTVTDKRTGLMWQKATDPTMRNWE
jgi:hypothetical protein